ncbi:hypothetical protein Cni_G19368 [Canna indica]|uniref:Reverse transcriptase n=1 Tax=Canna indica TaxID=4628 RepID=A0AAQ3KM25_9LILI|nr:hypothetical protein Cni_G19368 [Canna indica]
MAKTKWIHEGDRNTKYYQNLVKLRRRKNMIACIKVDNECYFSNEKICKCFVNFYSKLWTYQDPNFFNTSLCPIMNKLDDHAQNALVAYFTLDEIPIVVNSLGSGKSPGPDGFTGEFFKAYWNIISTTFMSAFKFFSY